MNVLVYGSLNIDLVFSVGHIVRPGETISSTALTRSAGGKGANQAAALAKAGVAVKLAGKVGQDGEFLLSLLESYGVDTSLVAVSDGATGQAIIQLDENKQNAIVLYGGGNREITEEEIEAVLAGFTAGDMIVLQNEISHTAEIIRQAKSRGMKVCLNPSPYDKFIEALPLDMVDMFFVNEIEGAALAGALADENFDIFITVVLEKLTNRFPDAEIILTAGRDGAYYAFQEERAHGAILNVPVVDTTGAGDTFTGYFLASRLRGYTAQQSLDTACRAASIAVSRFGAMEAVPAAAEVFGEGRKEKG
ncbi:MAG: ribokinase [Spirochaetaceae bacterium]|jgi:ribokinase|nr:ribokinase [Spirochaetaceae bacterium]